jgi:hypothetical protein
MELLAKVLHKAENIIGNTRALYYNYIAAIGRKSGSQTPCGLRRGSAASLLLGFSFRIRPRAWMLVFCECYML